MACVAGSVAFGTYTLSKKIDPYIKNGAQIAAGVETAGFYNFENPARPTPDLKVRAFANVGITSNSSVLAYVNHVGEMTDRRAGTQALPSGTAVDSFTTVDVHYNLALSDRLSFTASVLNAGDQDPPLAYGDLMYDSFNHSALGRIIKGGFKYRF